MGSYKVVKLLKFLAAEDSLGGSWAATPGAMSRMTAVLSGSKL